MIVHRNTMSSTKGTNAPQRTARPAALILRVPRAFERKSTNERWGRFQ
jgi:hypothetical protein